MDAKAIATLADSRLEAAVFEASYGYVVTVRYLRVEEVLGTKPFGKLADAMAYAKLLTEDYERDLLSVEHSRWAEKFGELAILFAHSRVGEWVGLLDTSRPSTFGPYFA